MFHKPLKSFLRNDILNLVPIQSANLCRLPQWMKIRRNKNKEGCTPPHVAIILSGCGMLDGTEISEAMAATFHLSEKGLLPKFYAPHVDVCKVMNHATREPYCNCTRDALVEAARIARCEIKPLCECEAGSHAALIIPGGFGVAEVLSDFASKGANCTVLPELQKIIEDFCCCKKPIGTICIAGVIAARVLKGVKITLGKKCPKEQWPHAEAIDKAKEMGAKVDMKDVKGVTRCKRYNVFSTPAWMYSCATYAEVNYGIGRLVTSLKRQIN